MIYDKAVEVHDGWELARVPLLLPLQVMGPTGNLNYLARSERQEYVYLRPIRLLNKSYGQSEKSFSSIVTMMECPIADFRDDGVIEHIEQFQMDDVCKDLLTYHVFYIRMVSDMKKPYDKQCLDIYVKECP